MRLGNASGRAQGLASHTVVPVPWDYMDNDRYMKFRKTERMFLEHSFHLQIGS